MPIPPPSSPLPSDSPTSPPGASSSAPSACEGATSPAQREILALGALALSRAIHARELSCREVMDAYLDGLDAAAAAQVISEMKRFGRTARDRTKRTFENTKNV